MDRAEIERRLEQGLTMVREGGAKALHHFRHRGELAVERKGLQDLVSMADRGVEDLLRERIAASFPGDQVLGEERGGGDAPRLWIIDPIDGTANFLRGMPYWCVTVAFVADGIPELAFTYDAVHDEMFAARRGHGTTRNGQPVTVSGCANAAEACIGISHNFKTPREAYALALGRLLEHDVDHRRMGSAALTLAHVADGRLDGMLAFLTNSWDVIPGLLLVAEAGGYATDFTKGHPLTERRDVIATSPALADLLRRAAGMPGA